MPKTKRVEAWVETKTIRFTAWVLWNKEEGELVTPEVFWSVDEARLHASLATDVNYSVLAAVVTVEVPNVAEDQDA